MEGHKNRLKEIREQKKLSQSDLGKALGTSRAMISQWERGNAKVSKQRQKDLAVILGVEEDFLFPMEETLPSIPLSGQVQNLLSTSQKAEKEIYETENSIKRELRFFQESCERLKALRWQMDMETLDIVRQAGQELVDILERQQVFICTEQFAKNETPLSKQELLDRYAHLLEKVQKERQ